MHGTNQLAIAPTKIYPLHELCDRFSIDPVHILKLAARAEINLCAPIPAGTRLYYYPRELIDEIPLDTDIELFVLFGIKTNFSLTRPVPAPLGALAVCVHPELILLIMSYGMARMRTFMSAHRIGMPQTSPTTKTSDVEPKRFAPHPSEYPFFIQTIDSHVLLKEDIPKGVINSTAKVAGSAVAVPGGASSFTGLLANKMKPGGGGGGGAVPSASQGGFTPPTPPSSGPQAEAPPSPSPAPSSSAPRSAPRGSNHFNGPSSGRTFEHDPGPPAGLLSNLGRPPSQS